MSAPAEGVRLHWEDLPPDVRAALEVRLGGHVVEAITQKTGFSPGLAARMRLEDGRRVFLKAVSEAANPDTPGIHRREARIVAALPPEALAPRLLWTYDEAGWVALCLEDVDGRHPYEPWTEADIELVVGALQKVSAALTPSPIATEETAAQAFERAINGWRIARDRRVDRLDPWCMKHLPRLADLEATAPEACAGETLLHFDTRADNMLRVFLVDWPCGLLCRPRAGASAQRTAHDARISSSTG